MVKGSPGSMREFPLTFSPARSAHSLYSPAYLRQITDTKSQ